MKITIETIPHDQQRYPTIGDWTIKHPVDLRAKPLLDDGSIQITEPEISIKVSRMADWRHEFLIGLHELVEVAMCDHAGITPEQVDQFDMAFEANRKPGDFFEPGYAENAPYRVQHLIAEGVEKIVAAQLGVDWAKYEKACDALFPEESGHPVPEGPAS